MDVTSKINELLQKYPDPRDGIDGKIDFERMLFYSSCPPVMGIVVDNKDPECLGRIRISMDMVIPGGVSPWLPVVRQTAKKGSGWWALPELGTQALAVFTAADRSKGYVLGFIYDRKHKPPKTTPGEPTQATLWQSKKHRAEIIDSDGNEELRVESKEGKMRITVSKNGGISIINELGDINISCRNFNLEGEEDVTLEGKDITIETEDSLEIKASENLNIESDKEVKLKGKNIKMHGTRGVATGGKQIAKQDDRVMGFDTHMMVVPAGTSTATVPLPHPFIGQIKDKVSSDVKIDDKGVAVKGSKAKHQSSTHMQLPGTIKFQNNPKCEGEVTGNTVSKVKVDGKEVAVLGSQLTTCNDVGMQNNSTIIAMGASFPMPDIINPLNMEQYKKDRENKGKKEPQFTSVKWASSSTEEGKEVELTASVKDIEDGNMVTMLVFEANHGPESGIEYARLPLTVRNGSVSAKWSYRADSREMPPSSDPSFICCAYSAWCNFMKSSNSLTVKLKRPEVTKIDFSSSKGTVGEPLKITASCRDFEEGAGLTFTVIDKKTGETAAKFGAEVKGSKAEAEWITTETRNIEEGEKDKLEYIVEATNPRIKKYKSNAVRVKSPKVISMEWNKKAVYYGDKATIKIKTFELSDESPSCKLQIWEKDYTTEDDFILEKDITINSDEVEQEIEFNFDTSRILDEEIDGELEVFCRLIYKDKDIASGTDSRLTVRTERGRR